MQLNYEKLRSLQKAVIERVIASVKAGKTDIFISAPTGTGKGLIALELCKYFAESESMPSYLLTSEKSLQQQYETDCLMNFDSRHDDMISLCGNDTYKCHVNDEKFSLGVCRMLGKGNTEALKLPCAATCEYLQRWVKAKERDKMITSYSYWLIQMNYVLTKMEERAPFDRRQLVICDEAHKLPDIIESHFACTIDKKVITSIHNTAVLLGSSKVFRRDLDFMDLLEAIEDAIKIPLKEKLEIHLDALKRIEKEYSYFFCRLLELKDDIAATYLSQKGSVSDLKRMANRLPREARSVLRLVDNIKDRHCKLQDYIENIEEHGLDNLIIDGEQPDSRTYHNLSDEKLFRDHFAKFSDVRVYLSATLQPDLLIKRWGIKSENASIIDVNSDWDVKKSRIILCDAGDMSYKNAEAGMKTAIREIARIFDEHKNDRGIIHTTSNAVTEEIANISRVSKRLVRYSSTKEKMEILADWENYPQDAVIIGPSLTTGIDLKDDLARFNIVVKLSFPNMKSALWAKRAEALPHIYLGETASVLEQACGRTTRSKEDSSISYILDSRAESFIKQNHAYFSRQFLYRLQLKA